VLDTASGSIEYPSLDHRVGKRQRQAAAAASEKKTMLSGLGGMLGTGWGWGGSPATKK
jgi:hypothetical protein